MVDWTKPMTQTFEYYEVDPATWNDKKKIDYVKSSTINNDSTSTTLGSASMDVVNLVGECYVRIYLVTIQNGNEERHPLGTFLVQTPQSSFDGKKNDVSMDAYTPLSELKENPVPLGYTLLKDENIMENAYRIARENCRCPVIETKSDKKLLNDFVSNIDDKYIGFLSDLIYQAKFEFGLDEMGRILFKPIQKAESLQPRWTFNDDNSSILLPDLRLKHDLYGIPNVVEVICSSPTGTMKSVAINDDSNSPTSIQRRGRKIIHRVTSPNLPGIPTQEQIDEYAILTLEKMSSVEYTVTFSHGYCPIRIGDCVRLNYKKAGIEDVKAKVISQSIKCKAGCEVSTTATFTKKLWK